MARLRWYFASRLCITVRSSSVMVLLRAKGCVCPGPGFPVDKFIDSICFPEKFSSPCFVPRFRPKPLSAFDDLKKAITVHANVPIRVRMDRRFAFPHKGPYALDARATRRRAKWPGAKFDRLFRNRYRRQLFRPSDDDSKTTDSCNSIRGLTLPIKVAPGRMTAKTALIQGLAEATETPNGRQPGASLR